MRGEIRKIRASLAEIKANTAGLLK